MALTKSDKEVIKDMIYEAMVTCGIAEPLDTTTADPMMKPPIPSAGIAVSQRVFGPYTGNGKSDTGGCGVYAGKARLFG